MADARDKGKKPKPRYNDISRPEDSYQKGRDEMDTLCHHDASTMEIVRSVRAWLRDRDNERTRYEDRQYTVPINRHGGGHVLNDREYYYARFTRHQTE